MKEPSVLTRMRLSCCWGDNLNEKELNEVVDYINYLQKQNTELKDNWNKLKEWLEKEGDKTLYILYEKVLIEMQELEKGGMNE